MPRPTWEKGLLIGGGLLGAGALGWFLRCVLAPCCSGRTGLQFSINPPTAAHGYTVQLTVKGAAAGDELALEDASTGATFETFSSQGPSTQVGWVVTDGLQATYLVVVDLTTGARSNAIDFIPIAAGS